MVEAVASGILSYLDRPFAFFGHSMGALLSFELARYLRRHHDLSPVRLIVSAHNAPQIPYGDPPIHDLPEPEFVESLQELKGMSPEVVESPELMELLLPILRADFAVCETYQHKDDEPLHCPISAFGGLGDEHVSRENLMAWREHTLAAFSLRMFPGDHFYLHTGRPLLLRALSQELGDSPDAAASVSRSGGGLGASIA